MTSLQLLFFSFPFAVALAVGLLAPLLAVVTYRHIGVGAGLMALTFCLNATFPGLAQGGIQVGIRLDITDLVALLLIPVTLLRFALSPDHRVRSPAFYVFLAVLTLNVAHGLVVFKAAAGAAARPEIYAAVAAGYVSTFPLDRQALRSLLRVLLAAVGWLVLLALYRWLIVAFDVRELLPASGSFQPAGHSVWRVIISSETLLLAELAVLVWFFGKRSQLLQGWQLAALPLLAMVLVLQHRSTWLAAIVAMVVAMLALRRAGGQVVGRALPFMVVLVVVAAAVVVLGRGGAGGEVAQSAADAVAMRGTAAARLTSWQQLVKNWAGSGPRSIVLGNPAGTTYERFTSEDPGAREVRFQAHNYYVTVLTTHGLVCFAAFLTLLGSLAWRLLQAVRLPGEGDVAGVLLVMLAGQFAYYLTYGTDYMQWLFLGAALSYTSHVGQRRGEVAAAATDVAPLAGATTWVGAARPRVPVRRWGAR
jgi:O-Antigen ligase